MFKGDKLTKLILYTSMHPSLEVNAAEYSKTY